MVVEYVAALKELLINENKETGKKTITDENLLDLINKINVLEEYEVISLLTKISKTKNFEFVSYKEYVSNTTKYFRIVSKYLNFNFEVEKMINFNEPIDIFISHTSNFDYIVDKFKNLLTDHGVKRVNITMEHAREKLEIMPGEKYLEQIKGHIKESDVFVCLINEEFSNSQMCNIEYGMALAYDLLILPMYSSDEAKENDKIYNNTAHIESISSKRYITSILRYMDVTPQDELIEKFILSLND